MSRWLRVLLILALLVSAPGSEATAGELTELVAPYLKAQQEQAFGEVVGHAFTESLRPQQAPTPRPSVSILLLPYSSQFEAQLAVIKAGLRDSRNNYTGAVTRLEGVRVAYQRALGEAGAGDLIREAITDGAGALRLTAVPAGDWLLVAWREEAHVTKTSTLSADVQQKYPNTPLVVDYSTVTYWVRRITVTAGELSDLTLSDRGVWMTGVRQEVLKTANDAPPKATGSQRRSGGPRN
jgi:hypothetical protein